MKDRFAGPHLDFAGFVVSLLCAIHCAFYPLIFSFSSLIGLSFLNDPWFEYGIILLSFFIASHALIFGYRHYHHKPHALVMVLKGFVLIGMGHVLHINWAEITFTSLGAILIASAHFINWKHIRHELLKQHVGE